MTIAFPCTTLLVQPKLKYLLTYTPNLVLVGTALSLVSATAFAEQKASIKYKEYPINEEFRKSMGFTAQEGPILGKAGDYLTKKSDIAGK